MLRFDNVERRDWDFVSMLFSDDHWIVCRLHPRKRLMRTESSSERSVVLMLVFCDEDMMMMMMIRSL